MTKAIPGDTRHLLMQLSAPDIADLCGVDERTAVRWQRGQGKVPPSALKLVTLQVSGVLQKEGQEFESKTVRAANMRARMLQFHDIYNEAWWVRMAQHGAPHYRREKVERFVKVLRRELENCEDPEALILAVADSLTAFAHGVPWER